MKPKRPTFTCYHCKQTFPALNSEADARAEYANEFPGFPIEDGIKVCDDCYHELMRLSAEQNELN